MNARDYNPGARLAYPAVLSVLLAAVTGVAYGTIATDANVVATALINVVYVVGLYCFVGNSGVMSFGHVGFAALGAYTVGLLTVPVEAKRVLLPNLPELLRLTTLPDTAAFALAGLVVAMIAGTFGAAVMKLKGIAASIVSLSFLVITHEVLNNWHGLGNGGTVTRIPAMTTVTQALAVACACIVIAYLFQTSRMGLRLRAARDEESAARSIGVAVTPERTAAFVLGAVLMAVGGGLSAQLNGTVSPGAFYLNLTFLCLAMLVVGGMRSLAGAMCGALVVSVLNELLRALENASGGAGGAIVGYRDVVLACVLVAILIWRPEGITRGREFTWLVRLRPTRRVVEQRLDNP